MNNMRPGGPNKQRSRGRGRGKPHGGGGGGGGPRHQGGSSSSSQHNPDQVFNIHRTIDSNGPDVKIRGNAHHVYEKYLQLARDANSSGDRVMAENYLQHAEHYYRLIMAFQASQQVQQGQQGNAQPYGGGNGQQGGYQNNGQHYRQPNGNGPQPGQDANGNTTEVSAAAEPQDEPYREEDQGRYD
ncbi:MAG: DUF4167 domain-containing protein [Micropepsaceae bacterium]